MKIAIVAPSPIPFNVGGAEKLWWGLQSFINTETVHHCELIKIPVDESNVVGLMKAYRDFYNLSLDHFDMVLSTKYPAWMVRHHNHHSYIQHTLRGLYDTYHFTRMPKDVHTDNPDILMFLSLLESADTEADTIFTEFETLRKKYPSEPMLTAFPGPFIRKVVHALDRAGMRRVRTFSCISNTVKNRTDYFPPDAVPQVIYHPSNLSGFRNGGRDYFFTVSRLDNAKRIRMIVEAYLKTDVKQPLLIAGTGPMEKELKDLASADSRIKFLGFVSDQDVLRYYADSLAVIFIPYDEDYGLITIEAMMSGKPVITFTDAGGVTEFVKEGVTGLISSPDASQLAENITKAADIFADGGCAQACIDAVSGITWESVALPLISKSRKDRRILVASTYPVYPAMGGGQLRLYHLLKRLTDSYKIDLICFGGVSEPVSTEVCLNFTQHTLPATPDFRKCVSAVEKRIGISADDLAFMKHYDALPEYVSLFRSLSVFADAVVCAQPYVYPMVKSVYRGFLVHDSQNVEYYLKQQMMQNKDDEILSELFSAEKELCEKADINIVCSDEDGGKFRSVYGLDGVGFFTVPNCVDVENIHMRTGEEKSVAKKKLGIGGLIAIFIGSWHQPNIDAVNSIFVMAESLPDITFMIVGSVGEYFKRKGAEHPANVGITGMVSDKEKDIWLTIADIALNPMMSGSGTNLKMLEYMAAGIPVVSTPTGARGLYVNNSLAYICSVEDFSATLSNVCYNTDDVLKINARKHAEQRFSWGSAALKLDSVLKTKLGQLK